jgi:hypothetical protein
MVESAHDEVFVKLAAVAPRGRRPGPAGAGRRCRSGCRASVRCACATPRRIAPRWRDLTAGGVGSDTRIGLCVPRQADRGIVAIATSRGERTLIRRHCHSVGRMPGAIRQASRQQDGASAHREAVAMTVREGQGRRMSLSSRATAHHLRQERPPSCAADKCPRPSPEDRHP